MMAGPLNLSLPKLHLRYVFRLFRPPKARSAVQLVTSRLSSTRLCFGTYIFCSRTDCSRNSTVGHLVYRYTGLAKRAYTHTHARARASTHASTHTHTHTHLHTQKKPPTWAFMMQLPQLCKYNLSSLYILSRPIMECGYPKYGQEVIKKAKHRGKHVCSSSHVYFALHSTRIHHLNAYIQNFPGEHAPRTPPKERGKATSSPSSKV